MWKTYHTLLVICIIRAVQVSGQCTLPSGCSSSSGTSVTCAGIDTLPTCLPDGYTSLTITNSPLLKNITSIPVGTTYLSMTDTGLRHIASSAIATAEALETLRVTDNDALQSLDLGQPSNTQLKTLYLANCTKLQAVSNVSQYISLTSITISYCDLRTIGKEQFKGLTQVRSLDISHNSRLHDIDEEAFQDLIKLQYLDMSQCSLTTLYGEYFDNAYHYDLKHVKALGNSFRCLEMCDFMRWYWKHQGFFTIGYIGKCTISDDDQTYVAVVYDLGRYGAGCPPFFGLILGVCLGVFFFACVAACIFVVVCGIDYRKYCCFCCESQRNRRREETEASGNDRTDADQETECLQAEKVQIQASGPMYSAAPPSYEDLTNPNIQEPADTSASQDPNESSSV